ncbi:bile acid:sodium symporter family protein [Oecophyllibacter saccharovorans]|uniref:bile acid:sodium symporter family protein n=1 Tax=Oecophyllibacter saccharovorans TaxID=2558360 RepID=UPI00116A123C|nr:bile acid:sodium symporter family protein [Oecophyllibacter saccharovorans]TPW33681.1 bile acid:sodium symporter [Oecophyllibacter saccharovorans]
MFRRLDPFLTCLLAAVALATVVPCPARWQPALAHLTSALIMLMFFFQGAKLKRSALVESLKDWQLQGAVLAVTFVVFPLVGLGLYAFCHRFAPHLLAPALWTGILFLCCLPSTVQSSIALTSIARGNVPAAICAATASNILGIFLTPLLTGLLLGPAVSGTGHGGTSALSTILAVARELLVPFIAGQCVQRWVGPVVARHKFLLSLTDRGSIIVMVYAAFSSAVLQGLWHRIPPLDFLTVTGVCFVLLVILLLLTVLLARLLGDDRADTIVLQFCGSKKSLATGVPMASVIFPAGAGIIVVPLMIYHQLQLFICTLLARHYARTFAESQAGAEPSRFQGTGTPST